jgi:hypothetical protein
MARFELRFGSVVVVIAVAMLFLPRPVFADTYQIFDMGGPRVIYGIDTAGDVVIFDPASDCDIFDHPCYDHFHMGAIISFSTVPPALNYDNGTPCSPSLPPGTVISHGVCNGAREAFGEVSPLLGLYTGPDPVADFVSGGVVNFIIMNASGDIAWSSPNGDMEAYNLTAHAPEPNTLMLLATGTLGALGALRRRVVKART